MSFNDSKYHVLVVAAGRGHRISDGLKESAPKQYIKIAGKPILRHTLENILTWPNVKSIKIVIHPDDAESYHNSVHGLKLEPECCGGKTRKESVYNGLKSFSNLEDEDIILIHDAARPFTSKADIEKLLEALQEHPAASLASQVTDSLRTTEGKNVERNELHALQTPQAFRYGDILRAHKAAPNNIDFTDDTAIAANAGIKSKLVEASRYNLKITTPEDIKMAEKLLSETKSARAGLGYDVHAFEKAPSNRKLMIGGINIPHTFALAGHSDADVALHAITDAILGAIGKGDIGQHFPPSDPAFKNMDSAIFLEKAIQMMKEQNGELSNIDLTIICEEPKIVPHVEIMQKRIASICAIDISRVNIKATTTEGLGFTGRKEGIAAQAIASVLM